MDWYLRPFLINASNTQYETWPSKRLNDSCALELFEFALAISFLLRGEYTPVKFHFGVVVFTELWQGLEVVFSKQALAEWIVVTEA